MRLALLSAVVLFLGGAACGPEGEDQTAQVQSAASPAPVSCLKTYIAPVGGPTLEQYCSAHPTTPECGGNCPP